MNIKHITVHVVPINTSTEFASNSEAFALKKCFYLTSVYVMNMQFVNDFATSNTSLYGQIFEPVTLYHFACSRDETCLRRSHADSHANNFTVK